MYFYGSALCFILLFPHLFYQICDFFSVETVRWKLHLAWISRQLHYFTHNFFFIGRVAVSFEWSSLQLFPNLFCLFHRRALQTLLSIVYLDSGFQSHGRFPDDIFASRWTYNKVSCSWKFMLFILYSFVIFIEIYWCPYCNFMEWNYMKNYKLNLILVINTTCARI